MFLRTNPGRNSLYISCRFHPICSCENLRTGPRRNWIRICTLTERSGCSADSSADSSANDGDCSARGNALANCKDASCRDVADASVDSGCYRALKQREMGCCITSGSEGNLPATTPPAENPSIPRPAVSTAGVARTPSVAPAPILAARCPMREKTH